MSDASLDFDLTDSGTLENDGSITNLSVTESISLDGISVLSSDAGASENNQSISSDNSSISSSTKSSKRRKKNVKSAKCWTQFEVINEIKARCKLCLNIYATSGNTSNAWNHLEAMHFDVYNELYSNFK